MLRSAASIRGTISGGEEGMNDSRIGNIPTAAANFVWSRAEKKVARAAFDLALGREFQAVMKKTKELAAKIEQPSDMWDLEAYLTRCRKKLVGNRLSVFSPAGSPRRADRKRPAQGR